MPKQSFVTVGKRLRLCEKDQSLAKQSHKVKNVGTKAIALWQIPFNCYLGSNCQLKRRLIEQEHEIRRAFNEVNKIFKKVHQISYK